MGCNKFLTKEDDKLLEAASRGEFSGLSPEMQEEIDKIMPQVKKEVQQKLTEIAKLQQPREERTMRLLKTGLDKTKETPIEKSEKDMKAYKAFGVCPVEVKNFSRSWLGSNKNVVEILDKLPQIGHLAFEKVEYTGELEAIRDPEGNVGIILGEATPDKSGRTEIKINEHRSEFFKDVEKIKDPEKRERRMQKKESDTLVHEWAEGVWRELTTLKERSQWRNLYWQSLRGESKFINDIARESTKEDFCECSMKFFTKPEILRCKDRNKYNFLTEFYNTLNKESEWLAEQFSKLEEGVSNKGDKT